MTDKTIDQKSKSIWKRFLDYLIKTLNGMAYGLFSTLIIGAIIGSVGTLLKDVTPQISEHLTILANFLKAMTGVGIGIGVAWSLNLVGLRLIAAGVAGGIASPLLSSNGYPGDPLVEYLCVVASIEILNLFYLLLDSLLEMKKTPIDIIIIPLLSAIIAYVVFLLIGAPVKAGTDAIGDFIKWATSVQPFFMGIIIAVVMGMALTAPISSAAIAISITLGGIAGGAAVVGCSVQMIGFAVMSRKDNNIGTVISVGIGTSMLQFKNILKKPIIWLPTIIVSAILGPLATIWLKTETDFLGSGMGTSGLVGQYFTFEAMGNTPAFWLSVILLMIALPIILVYIIDIIFRKYGLIVKGDLKI